MQPPQNPYQQPAYNGPPYPPPSPYSPPPQAPRGTVSIDAISEAWQFLSPNIGPWILAMVAYFGVSYGLSFVRGIFQAIGQSSGSSIWTVLALLIQFITWIAQQLLLGGTAKLAIQTVRTRVANINEMWTVTDVGVALVLSAILQAIFYLIVCIPGLVVLGVSVIAPLVKSGIFSPGVLTSSTPPTLPSSLIGAMAGGIALGVLLLLVAVIPLGSLLFLTTSLIVDRKIGPWEAISQSMGALKKHFGSALLLMFLLGLINMGGVLACCIGLLFTIPITQIAIAIVYRDLFGIGDGGPQQATVYAPPPIANPNF